MEQRKTVDDHLDSAAVAWWCREHIEVSDEDIPAPAPAGLTANARRGRLQGKTALGKHTGSGASSAVVTKRVQVVVTPALED